MMEDNYKYLDYLFKPRTVAVYKASEKLDYFFMGFKEHKFDTDKLYLINPEQEEVFGLKCLKSFSEIPEEEIDLLILAVGRDRILETIKMVINQKKINSMHIFTAGLGESDEIGKEIEKNLISILTNTKNHPRAIGPNCMGVYSPKGHLAYEPFLPTEPGNISFVFQSGDLHSQTLRIAASRYNLKFSKGASVGNCMDLQISDFLQYYNNDDETDIIGVYFEGFSKLHPDEGKNFLKVLRNMKKPVLFMNGGKTKRAQTAVLTHTGSIGSNERIWSALVKQTPIVEVPTSMDDMIDFLYLFDTYINRFKKSGTLIDNIKYPSGKNTLLILWSGGFGIIHTNILTELGMNVPYFEGETLEKLRKIYPVKIGSLNNPLDMPWISRSETYQEIAKTAIDENIDLVIIETDTWGDEFEEVHRSSYYNNLRKVRDYTESLGKIFILTLPLYPGKNRENYKNMLTKEGFIVYPSVRRAAKSFLALYEYGRKIKALKNQ
ncbi:MAG: CoA-binding protein [Promethearchaeota archaeon]|jgi:acyl-CoA synthetase (NDP forming)